MTVPNALRFRVFEINKKKKFLGLEEVLSTWGTRAIWGTFDAIEWHTSVK